MAGMGSRTLANDNEDHPSGSSKTFSPRPSQNRSRSLTSTNEYSKRRPLLRSAAGACSLLCAFVLVSCTQQQTVGAKKPNAIFVTTTLAPTSSTTPDDAETPVAPELGSVCPSRVVVQFDRGIDFWALPWIAMTASDGIATPTTYTALMVDPLERNPNGLSIELRAGGLKGQSSVAEILRRDPRVLVGSVNAATVLASGSKDRLRFILAPFERSDRAIAWDPAALPKDQSPIETLADLPPLKVQATSGDLAIGYFSNTGLIKKADFTSGKAQARFTSLLNEPNLYGQPKGARNWSFLDDAGWTTYPATVAVTPETLRTRKDCLAALSSLLQLSLGVVVGEPERFANNLASIANRMGSALEPGTIASQIRAAVQFGIIGTGDNTVIADVQPVRIEQTLRAIAKARKDKYKQKDIARLSKLVTTSLASFDWDWNPPTAAE
jgi:hypothetical protein